MTQLGQDLGEKVMRWEDVNPQDLPWQKSGLAPGNLELKTKRLGLGVPPGGEEIHMSELQRQNRSLVNFWLSDYSEEVLAGKQVSHDILPRT